MELCNVNLKDYINCGAVPLSDASRFWEEPVFVGDCSPNLHILNTWTIMNHIAQGLQVVHHKGYSHRDLKPENGLQTLILILMIVLYSHIDKVWKIADFGIASTVTSRRAITTRYARGTDGFRAPELLLEPSKFTNKVDIWAMGCILYQIATRKQLFPTDHFVRDFDHMDPKLDISDALVPESACPHLSECLRKILRNDSRQRPTVSFLNSLFESYCIIWDSSIVRILEGAKSFPPSSEWMKLIRETTGGMASFAPLLLDWHESNGRNESVIPLLNVSIEKFPNEPGLLDRLAELHEKARDWDAALVLRRKRILGNNHDDIGAQLEKIIACEKERNQEMARKREMTLELCRAARNGHVEAIKTLLKEMGADISVIDGRKRTPLHYAALNGHVEAIKTLKEMGANISAKTASEETPLHYAAGNGHVEAIKTLKKMGANVSAKTAYEQTPLHNAAWNGHVEAIKTLKKMGANVSAKTAYEQTPLHYAAWNGHIEAFKTLKEMGADVSAKDEAGDTPMRYAIQRGHFKAIQALREVGVDVLAKDDNQKTPMRSRQGFGLFQAFGLK